MEFTILLGATYTTICEETFEYYRESYNHFHDNLRHFDVLPDFPFTTSEKMRNITYKHGIFEMPQGLRKLGKIRKVSKLHKNDNLVASLPAKKKILLILAKNS